MSKTKKLKQGYPVVDANGAITSLSIDEIARRVGEQLGVQRKKLGNIKTGDNDEWYRVGKFTTYSISGLLILNHRWASGAPAGMVIAFSGSAPNPNNSSLEQLAGSNSTFSKARIAYIGSEYFLELMIKSKKTLDIDEMVLATSQITLLDTPTLVTDNPTVLREVTLTDKIGGGKRLNIKHLQSITPQFGNAAGKEVAVA